MRKVNWSQAIAEVGLLLLGAGIALGVDSWRDRANELAAEQRYLTSLRTDFETTDSVFRFNLAAYEDQLRHNAAFLEILAGPVGSVAPDSLARLVRKSFLWGGFTPVLATYRDMTNSGDLRLLRNDELRLALAQFESVIEETESLNRLALDQWNTSVTPYYIGHFNVTDLYGSESRFQWGQMEVEPYRMPLVDRIQVDPNSYWSREFVNLIAVRNISLGDAILHGTRSLGSIGMVLQLIDESKEGGREDSSDTTHSSGR